MTSDGVRTADGTLHPADAEARGITSGDRVEVFNDRGTVAAEARVDAGVMPGVAVVPYGFWTAGGSTVSALISSDTNDLGRGPRYSGAAVDVRTVRDAVAVP